jgi:acetyltransferase EpsM
MNTKPLIFLGSNSNLALFAETAENMGIAVAGILDDNYFGNTDYICDIPVIGSEDTFKFESEKDNYLFFIGASVVPINITDRVKRQKMIKIVEKFNLNLATLTHKFCEISKSVVLHPGCYIGYCAGIGYKTILMPHSQVHAYSGIAHNSILGKNSVVERRVSIAGSITIGENVHIGFDSVIAKAKTVGDNSVIHPRITVLRDVDENEIISLAGSNTRKIYGEIIRS